MKASSRTLPHVGEWKVELRAATLAALFGQLARTIADAAGAATPPRALGSWERVELHARDHATLLVDWANDLIGRGEVAGLAYGTVQNLVIGSTRDGTLRLTAEVRGHSVDDWVSPVKAATYHGALVARDGKAWRAVVLFDV